MTNEELEQEAMNEIIEEYAILLKKHAILLKEHAILQLKLNFGIPSDRR